MDNKALTKENVLIREEELENLFNLIKSRIDTKVTEIAIDKDRMGYLVKDFNYDYAVDSFCLYFKEKYQVNNIESFYIDKIEMMRDVYIRCLMPFNLELDIKFGNDPLAKEDVVTGIKRLFIWIKNTIQLFYINIIATLVLILTCYFSFYYARINEIWLSNLFLGASSSILAAIIITTINRHIKKVLSQLEFQENYVREELLRYLKLLTSDVENIKKYTKEEKSQFILNFVDINNGLDQHLKFMKKFLSITTLEYFIEMNRLEKKMFDKSSKIVKREITNEFHGLTENERDELNCRCLI